MTAVTACSKRNAGIDALRVVSMLMVVVLHILNGGGVLAALPADSLRSDAAYLLNAAVCCAVNCFGLVSGYVSADKPGNSSRLMLLWLQVAFYTVGITALFALLWPQSVGWRSLLSACFPVITKKYWYFTAFFGLWFFQPVLNHLVRTLTPSTLKRLLCSFFLLASLLPTAAGIDLFTFNAGYSMLWLICLYLIGAYFKTYPPRRPRPVRYLAGYVLCAAGAWLGWLITNRLCLLLGAEPSGIRFFSYCSPFILMESVFLLLFCSGLAGCGPRLSSFWRRLGDISFGVYLIHVNGLVWQKFIVNGFVFLCQLSPWLMFPALLLCAFGVLLSCMAIDAVRLALFRLLRLSRLTGWLAQAIQNKTGRLFAENAPK